MTDTCTLERFLGDIAEHSMEILQDDGVYRHIKFSENGSSIYHFCITTWPGHLAISGDCGDYVFARVRDMFEFFWMGENDYKNNPANKLSINHSYWAEKCTAVSKNSPLMTYEEDRARAGVLELIEQMNTNCLDEESKVDGNAIMEEIAFCDGKHEFSRSVYYLNSDLLKGNQIDGESIPDPMVWGYHYTWCLYAIVHGIKEYRKFKAAESNSRNK